MTASNFTLLSDEEREESILERRERERGENGKVDNEEAMPLIPNVKLDARKTIVHLEVHKMDSPGDGYKGNVPTNSNLNTIAKLFGNGIYDFHAVTQDGKVLRRNQGVKVSIVSTVEPNPPSEKQTSDEPNLHLLKWQAEQHERDARRIESFGNMTVTTAREMSKTQMDTMTAHFRDSQERDRSFFSGLLAQQNQAAQQQQQFFANMLQLSAQQHQQAMDRQRADFEQSIARIQVFQDVERQNNNPMALFEAARALLSLGSGSNESEEDEQQTPQVEPWVEVFKEGAAAIKEVAVAASSKMGVPKAAPAPAPQRRPQPRRDKKPPPFTKEELAELLRMKQIMDQNNLDLVQTVRQASQYLVGTKPATESQDAPESAYESGDSEPEDLTPEGGE